MGPYLLPPIKGIEIYKEDLIVVRGSFKSLKCLDPWQDENALQLEMRGKITSLSKASRHRLAFVVCNTDVIFRTMITLTYPKVYPNDGHQAKRHLHAFLQWMRRRWDNVSYVWFIEFQTRGAPHFHILLSITRRKEDIDDVAMAWDRIVDSGDCLHIKAGTRTERIRKKDGAKRYCVKYAMKLKQKTLPDGYRDIGRWWGYSYDVRPIPIARIDIDELSLRVLLSDWRFMPDKGKDLYRILFGASQSLAHRIPKVLDNESQV